MPIIGRLGNVYLPDQILEKMEIGAIAYIHGDYVLLTKKAICLLRESEAIPTDEFDEENDDEDAKEYIKVSRIGEGLTDEDFNIDLVNCEFDFKILPEQHLNGWEDKYVIFPYDPMKEINEAKDVLHDTLVDDPLVKLNKELEEAAEAQDFLKAATLRDEIAELEKKEKNEKVE